MEVLVGPTLGIEVSSGPACVRDCTGGPAQDKHGVGRFSSPFLKDGERENAEFQPMIGESVGRNFGLGIGRSKKPEAEEEELSESSSIGEPDESEDHDDDDGEAEEVQSKFSGGLGSLGSLEESLPIKRGLSNYFSGKSKSFANISDVNSLKDLEKQENPLNKRRRTLMACKWAKKSFYTWSNPTSMPLLALKEEDQEEEQEQEEEEERPKLKFKSFKSSSCFSLTDLQQQHHA
ncbi:hypothetical protein L1049_018625 [Liquidambar formosana]|uniref:Uncharacterized protein n=1 Tax=Liquidambar formosana TaxID=63359 RepID=A0AAP0RAC7_LIQFO